MDIVRLWCLRGIIENGGVKFHWIVDDDDVRQFAGLQELLGRPIDAAKSRGGGGREASEEIVSDVRTAISQVEGDRNDPLIVRSDEFAARLCLNDIERDVLAMVALNSLHPGIGMVVNHGPNSFLPSCRWLAHVLGHSEQQAREAMSPRGTLARIGLIDPKTRRASLSGIMEPSLAMAASLISGEPLVDAFFTQARPGTLAIADYPHLEREIRLATSYLRRTAERRSAGVNLLLHGPPGTGKTELAQLLAAEVDVPAYAVSIPDASDREGSGRVRLANYLVCQRALGPGGGVMVIFDEVEDVFPVQHHPFFGAVSDKTTNKAWLCGVLEENRLPSIWIANTVCHIDPAFLRRFDMVIEVPVPPRDVRRRVAEKYFGELSVAPRLADEIAACENVSPSDVQRAAKVARLAAEDDPERRTEAMRTVLGSSLSARGQRYAVERHGGGNPAYDLSLVRASCDLDRLVDSLGKEPIGTICLHGPPGTGKTAFVKHAAERLGLELVVRRGSDLLSKWVGETEARIARMFRDARPRKELLLLDEGDSFLRCRDLARASWEVTQVNELLTQMEAFEGLFICATNLVDDLDEAAFRRFGLKVRFDHLDADRRFRFACSELAALGMAMTATESAEFRRRLDALDHLSLGDFAAVRRRFKLVAPPTTAASYVDALAEERAFKREARVHRVGFTA